MSEELQNKEEQTSDAKPVSEKKQKRQLDEKSKKRILIITACLLFIVALILILVFTLKKCDNNTEPDLKGKVTFETTDANVSVSQGALEHTDGTSYNDAYNGDISNILKPLDFTAGGEEPADLTSWANLNFNFNKTKDDLVVRFTITNNGTEKLDFVTVNVISPDTTESNVEVLLSSNYEVLAPVGNTLLSNQVEYTITFSVPDKEKAASLKDFEIKFDIDKNEDLGKSDISGDVNFSSTNTNITISDAKFTHLDGSAYNANVSDNALDDIVKDLVFTAGGTAPVDLSTWKNLELNFDSEKSDMLLKFKVKNNSTRKLDYVSFNSNVTVPSGSNVAVEVLDSSILLEPNTENSEREVVVKFSVIDKTRTSKVSGIVVNFLSTIDEEKSKANLTGGVTFNVSDADVTITNAKFTHIDGSDYDANVSDSALSSFFKNLVFTKGGQSPENLSSWQNLKLNFDKDLNDLVLKFTVTNKGEGKLDYLRVNADPTFGSNIKITTTESTLLEPKKLGELAKEVEYKITFAVADKTKPFTATNFNVVIEIAKDQEKGKANLSGNVNFNVTDADVSVTNARFVHTDGSAYDANVSDLPLALQMLNLTFTEEGTVPTNLSTWKNLKLNFDEDLNDLILKFIVTNKGFEKLDYLRVSANATAGSNISITTTQSTLIPPDKVIGTDHIVEYEIRFSVKDKTQKPIASNFDVEIKIEKDQEKSNANLIGNVLFNVSDANATVSNARFVYSDGSKYEANVSENDTLSLVKDLVFTRDGQTPENLSSWQGLKLNFDEELSDIVLKFKVINNGRRGLDFIRVSALAQSNSNIEITSTSSTLLTPVRESETTNETEFVITFSVIDKTQRPAPTDFTVTVTVEKDEELGKSDLEGGVTFDVTDANVTVSEATLSYNAYVGDESVIMPELTFTKEADAPVGVANWSDLQLNFNENKDDIVITLLVTNNGEDASDFVDVITAKTSQNENIAVSVSANSTLLAPSSNTYLENEVELTITISMIDKSQTTRLNHFSIDFTIAKNTEAVVASTIENIEFDYNFDKHTASIKTVTLSENGENLSIPEKIRFDEDGEIYTFTSIDFAKFDGLNVGTLSLPKSVNEISIGAGTYVDNTHTTRYYDTNWTCQHIVIDEANTTYRTIDDAIVAIENNELIFSVNLTESNARTTGVTTVIPEGVVYIGNDALYTLVTKFSDAEKKVVSRESAFTNVYIPESVKFIGSRVFQDATRLENVEFPSALQAIGNNAFNNTKALNEDIVFPNTVRTIGESAFRYSGITGITLPSSLEKVSNRSFAVCPNLAGNVTIPVNVEVIEEYAFYEDANIQSLSMGESVTHIGQRAFSACRGMTTATISESIQVLGDYAFGFCESLTSQIILPNATDIGSFAFTECKLLPTIEINSTLTEIKESTFAGCSNFTNVYIPTNVKTIGKNAFLRCGGMTDLTIAEGVVTIGEQAFHQCSLITEVEIPASVKTIGNGAFNACSNLANVVLNEGVVTIGNSAFSGCRNLDKMYVKGTNEADVTNGSIILPNSLETLGNQAFYNLQQIKKLTIGENLVSIGDATFFGTGIEGELDLKNVTSIGTQTFQGAKITGLTFSGEGVTLGNQAFFNCASLIRVDTANNGYIKEVGNDAFNGARQLEYIDFKEGLESIGEKAFYQCINLDVELTLTSSMKNIGSYAFFGCVNLKTVVLDGITEIKEATFSGCTSITDLILPDTLEVIGVSAFSGCTGLNELTIPESVTTISENAFYNCTNLYYVQIDSDTVAQTGFGSKRNDQGYLTAYAKIVYARSQNVAFTTEWRNHQSHPITNPPSYTVTDSEGSEITYYGYTNWYPDITGSASFTTYDGFVFTKERGQYYLDGYVGSQSNIMLPTTYRRSSYTLRKINSPAVFSVTVPDIEIANFAFEGNEKLAEIINKSAIDLASEKVVYGIGEDINVIEDASASTLYIDNDGFVFNEIKGEKYLIAYIGSNEEIVLPSSYNDSIYKIKSYAFYNNDTIIKVEIPEGITEIGLNAFENCSMLASAKIPSTVTLIGETDDQFILDKDGEPTNKKNTDETIFKGCTKLVEVVNLSGVQVATPDSNATIITSGDSTVEITDYVFYGEAGNYTLIQYIGEETRLTLPESYKGEQYNIRANAFDGSALKYVKITSGVKSIGDYAFNRCRSLATVEFEEGVESIGDYAFYYTPISEITLPTTIKSIGRYAFNSCGGLKTVNLNEGLKVIDSAAFGACSALNKINLPSTLETVGTYVFNGAINLKTITIPSSLKVINDYMFNGCSGLESVEIENGVNTISFMAFRNCTSLTDIVTPESVKTILNNAFENCSNLRNVVLNGVETIGEWAFDKCVELTDISIPETIENISKFAFGDINTGGAYYEQYVPTPNCTKLSYTIEGGLRYLGNANNPYVYLISNADEGHYYSSFEIAEGCKIIGYSLFIDRWEISSIEIPSSVKFIYPYAFYNCGNLNEVVFNEGLTHIENNAFNNCFKLGAVEFPSTLMFIGKNAFYGCSSLTSLFLPSNVESIGENAFLGNSKLETITLNEGLLSIGSRAFEGCGLVETITIPSTVTSVYPSTFDDCTNLLEVINLSKVNLIINNGYTSVVTSLSDVSIDRITEAGYVFYKYNNQYYLAHCESDATEIVLPGYYKGEEYNISRNAFAKCPNVTTITIPASVRNVDANAFAGCTNLTKIINYTGTNIATGNYSTENRDEFDLTGDGWTATTSDDVVDEYENVTSTTTYENSEWQFKEEILTNKEGQLVSTTVTLVKYTGSATNLIIPKFAPEKNYKIGAEAFKANTVLESVIIPSCVKEIEANAFNSCNHLKTVELNKGLTTIGSSAFASCQSLEQITIPSSVKTIGSYTFNGAIKLKVANIEAEVALPSNMFRNCAALTNVTIGDKVGSIGQQVFFGCSALTDVKIGSKVSGIDNQAFMGCSSLKEIILPANVKTIGTNAFENCTSLENVDMKTINNSKEVTIASKAFLNCTGLTKFIVASSVKTIAADAFEGCTNLAVVVNLTGKDLTLIGNFIIVEDLKELEDKVEIIDGYTFRTTYNGVTTLEKMPSGQTELTLPTLPDGKTYKIIAGVFQNNQVITSVSIPGCVTEIADDAFNGCRGLKTVAIEEGNLEYIGIRAFAACYALDTINIPETVKTIGNYAFNSCKVLTRVVIPASVESVGASAFIHCTITIVDLTNLDLQSKLTGGTDGVLTFKTTLD